MLEHQKVFSTGSHGNGPEMVIANSRSSPCLGLNRCIHYHLWKSNHVKSRFLLVKMYKYHQFDCFESPLVVAPRSTSFHQKIHCRCPNISKNPHCFQGTIPGILSNRPSECRRQGLRRWTSELSLPSRRLAKKRMASRFEEIPGLEMAFQILVGDDLYLQGVPPNFLSARVYESGLDIGGSCHPESISKPRWVRLLSTCGRMGWVSSILWLSNFMWRRTMATKDLCSFWRWFFRSSPGWS